MTVRARGYSVNFAVHNLGNQLGPGQVPFAPDVRDYDLYYTGPGRVPRFWNPKLGAKSSLNLTYWAPDMDMGQNGQIAFTPHVKIRLPHRVGAIAISQHGSARPSTAARVAPVQVPSWRTRFG